MVSYRLYRGASPGSYSIYYSSSVPRFTDRNTGGTSGSPKIVYDAPITTLRHEYIELSPTPTINIITSQRS